MYIRTADYSDTIYEADTRMPIAQLSTPTSLAWVMMTSPEGAQDKSPRMRAFVLLMAVLPVLQEGNSATQSPNDRCRIAAAREGGIGDDFQNCRDP